jgi:hypothetical protein
MVPKHTFVTSMSDAPSVILRRLVLGMSVIVALSLSFSLFFSLFPFLVLVLPFSLPLGRTPRSAKPATTFRRLD